MSKKEIELEILRMSFGGEAIASHQGKKIFLPWGAPGDKVRAEIVLDKKDYARAKILEVLQKSPHRTKPLCPVFYQCGGCQWQHLNYQSQIHFKQQLLLEALERIGHIRNPHLLAPLAAQNPFHYRSKIRLQVSRQGEVGFFKAHSKHVIPIQHCLIADERLNQSIPEAAQIAQKLLKEDRASRHEIELRIDEKNQVRLSSETSSFDLGEEASFIQVNAAQNEHLVETALQALNLSGSEKVLELFAGEGNFTFPLSKQAGHVTAVELSETAVLRAEARKQKEHVRTVEFIQSSAYRYLEETRKRNPKKFDLILLDPPRKGAFECMASIAQVRAKTIVYVSCDPSTLARDLRVLTDLGYRHESSQIIDMFPQTYHIESVTKLTLDEL